MRFYALGVVYQIAVWGDLLNGGYILLGLGTEITPWVVRFVYPKCRFFMKSTKTIPTLLTSNFIFRYMNIDYFGRLEQPTKATSLQHDISSSALESTTTSQSTSNAIPIFKLLLNQNHYTRAIVDNSCRDAENCLDKKCNRWQYVIV